MNKAKIKFELDLDSPLGKRVFANLAASFGEVNVTETTFLEVVKDEVTDTATPAVVEPKKRASRAVVKETPVEAEAPEAEEVETPAAEVVEEGDTSGEDIKLGDIKAEIAKKVAKHRDAIKAELTRLGAENSDKLPKSDYVAFHKFLTEL